MRSRAAWWASDFGAGGFLDAEGLAVARELGVAPAVDDDNGVEVLAGCDPTLRAAVGACDGVGAVHGDLGGVRRGTLGVGDAVVRTPTMLRTGTCN